MDESEINTLALRYVEEEVLDPDAVERYFVSEFLWDNADSSAGEIEIFDTDIHAVQEKVVSIITFLRDRVDLYFDQ